MAKKTWRSFQEAVAEVHGDHSGFSALKTTLQITGAKPCPAPDWDHAGTYRVALVGEAPQIQRLAGQDVWVAAPLQPPAAAVGGAIGASEAHDEVVTRSTNILFMDVSGWSKLGADKIHEYVTRAMPRVAKELTGYDFLNTWGDAIIATFSSAKSAAESALKMRDFFERALPRDGIPAGLSCRIALHQGEVIVCANPLLQRQDVFGDAVHVAARLEPVTAPGQVFCTSAFAQALASVANLAPRATRVGAVQLAKAYGEIEAYVVTWPNEPASILDRSEKESTPSPAQAPALHDGEDAAALLLGWINKMPVSRSGSSFVLSDIDNELGLHPGAAGRLIESVVSSRDGGWAIEKKTDRVVVLRCNVGGPVVVSEPRRGW
jgi:class 3 adenylate cyclase